MTEYLPREISPFVDRDRAGQKDYTKQLLDVMSHIGGRNQSALTKLSALVFHGDLSHIKTLGGVPPSL